MATYLLLDGFSLAYRAWFALQDAGMKTSSGQETQAIYGFVSMATKLLGDFEPTGMAVAFDRHGPTFRDSITDDYKAGRPPQPEPLTTQIELIRQFVDALGIPGVDAENYEADDVLATMATRLCEAGQDVIVVTGDRDAFQLVQDPHIKVLYNRRGVSDYVLYDEAGIFERTGVKPVDYPLLAALRGDPSDNLPGVPGVGEKTAAKLVTKYETIDNLFEHVAECTPKLRESLTASEARVRKNFQLTPVVRDVPVEIDFDALALGSSDRDALSQLFTFLEMRTPRDRLFTVLDRIEGTTSTKDDVAPEDALPVTVLDSAEVISARIKHLLSATGSIAIEAAWSGAPGRSAIDGLAFALDGGDDLAFLPGTLLGEEPVMAAVKELLTAGDPAVSGRIVGHHAKELMRSLLENGIDWTNLGLDTAVAAYIVDPAEGMASIEDLASKRGLSLHGAGATSSGGQLGFDLDGSEVEVAEQTARRADLIGRLATLLSAELDEIGGQELYDEIERPLVRVLAKMEVAGVAVDIDRLREINTALTDEANAMEKRIHELAGMEFNVNSTKQLRTVLYENLGLRPQRKTKTGYSTDAQTLEKLRGEHEIVDALLRYREVEKLRSTYGEGLMAEVAPDGRIHASFDQTVARTGRLSSNQPNLHNIPVRSEEGRRFREAFIPAKGMDLLVADYNQIELRVIAHLANDPGLVGAFAAGEDIHASTAARLFSVEPSEVTSAMRSKAKMVSYGLAYGMEAYGLAQRLGIEVGEAAGILDQYFAAFPQVRSYMDQTVAEAKARGYTETARGRRRYLPELASDNFRVRQAAERQAMNAGIQGLAADIFKIALVNLDAAVESRGLKARIVLQVHDEVILEAPADEHDEVEQITRDAMGTAYPLSVPLEVHLAWGASWADAK